MHDLVVLTGTLRLYFLSRRRSCLLSLGRFHFVNVRRPIERVQTPPFLLRAIQFIPSSIPPDLSTLTWVFRSWRRTMITTMKVVSQPKSTTLLVILFFVEFVAFVSIRFSFVAEISLVLSGFKARMFYVKSTRCGSAACLADLCEKGSFLLRHIYWFIQWIPCNVEVSLRCSPLRSMHWSALAFQISLVFYACAGDDYLRWRIKLPFRSYLVLMWWSNQCSSNFKPFCFKLACSFSFRGMFSLSRNREEHGPTGGESFPWSSIWCQKMLTGILIANWYLRRLICMCNYVEIYCI